MGATYPMKVSVPSGDWFIASSDLEEKLVARLIPMAAAASVRLKLLTSVPLVVN